MKTPFVVLALAAALGTAATCSAASVPTLAPDALRAGQRALVRTVFVGDSIETFEAEIVGVVPGGGAEGDLILARATTPRVEHVGVAQGMSGSPVFVDGRLIGALSSGWSFTKDAIFGITPIAEMLRVLDLPETPRVDGAAGPTGVDPLPAGAPRYRGLSWTDAPGPEALPTPAAARPAHALPLPLAAGGLQPSLLPAAEALFAPMGLQVTPGGRARRAPASRPVPAPRLEPGAAVAVDVLRGDVNLAAIGTVTYVDGDRVLIFGHPFFQSGEVRLPLSTAHITTILPSLSTSFKIGVPGTPIGTVTQDRRAAVAGRLGAVPSLLPFGITVRRSGEPPQRFRFEAVEDRSLLPQLVSTAAVNSLLESGGAGAQQTVRWSLRAHRGGDVLTVGDVAAGESPLNDLLGAFVSPLRFLYGNPFERFHLDSLSLDIAIVTGREQSTLRSASLARPSVRPGGTVRVQCDIEPWRGPRETRTIDLRVPEELGEGRYVLWLGGGSEADRITASRLPGRFRPVSVRDAWHRLGTLRSSDALYSLLWSRAPEVTSDGLDYPELPNSAFALMSPPQLAGTAVQRGRWALIDERRLPVDGVLRGELLLEIHVDPEAP